MLLAADNLTASRPSIRRALEQRDAEAIAGLCAQVQAAGAQLLDLNPGFVAARKRREVWRFLIETAEKSCSLTLMIDTPRAKDMELALGFCSRPPVLNMATAEEHRLGPVLDLAAAHHLMVIAALMTRTAPLDGEERLALAAVIMAEAAKRGIEGERIFLDPMLMPLGLPQGQSHARAVLQCLRGIPQVFDSPPRTLLALSNLVTRTAGVETGFAAGPFLAAAWGAGLAAVMLDALDPRLMGTARLLEVFGGERVFAPSEFL